jgi:hypothetical protein
MQFLWSFLTLEKQPSPQVFGKKASSTRTGRRYCVRRKSEANERERERERNKEEVSFKISNKEPLFALRSESLRERDGQRIFPTLAALKTVEKLQVASETERERRKKTHIILRG